MKHFFLFILTVCTVLNIQAQQKTYDFLNADGESIFQITADQVSMMYDYVIISNRIAEHEYANGVVDLNQAKITVPVSAENTYIEMVDEHGLIPVQRGETMGSLNAKTGAIVVPFAEHNVYSPSVDGYSKASISKEVDGAYYDITSIYDASGKKLFEGKTSLNLLSGGLFFKSDDGKLQGPFAADGMALPKEDTYDGYSISFDNGLATVEKDGFMGVIDTNGNVIIPFEWDNISINPNQLFAVSKGDEAGIINEKGEWIVPLRPGKAYGFSIDSHTIKFKEGDRYGFMNLDGKVIQEAVFESLNQRGSLLNYRKDGEIGIIKADGTPFYTLGTSGSIGGVSDQAIGIRKDGKAGIINFDKEEVLPFAYEQVNYLGNEYWNVVMGDGFMGLFHEEKGWLYKDLDELRGIYIGTKDSEIKFIKDGLMGGVKGEMHVKPMYSFIEFGNNYVAVIK